MKDYYREADGTCHQLPPDGFNKAVGLTLATLDVEKGWFRLGQESSTAYPCPYPAHCTGGANTSEGSQCSSVSQGVLCFEWWVLKPATFDPPLPLPATSTTTLTNALRS